jgi:molybdopterin converting factor small subunit
MATVLVPSSLRDFCAGAARLEVPGATLGEVLRALDVRCPGFYDRVVENGAVRPALAIAIDSEAAGYPLHEPLGPASEVAILPAIGGG